jgi:hypothetical protein
MPDKPETAEDYLSQRISEMYVKGEFDRPPAFITYPNIAKIMVEYSSLVLQECIKEMESYKKSMFPNPDILFQREIGQDDMISILKKRMEGNK